MRLNGYDNLEGIGMGKQNGMMKRIAKLGWILMMGASLNACSSDQHWKEEVQLSDGRIIVIERDLIAESGGDEWALNRTGSKPKEYRIRFEYPDGAGKAVEWRSTKIDVQTYPEKPLVLDMEYELPVVFSSGYVRGCQMYFKYIWRNGTWAEESLPLVFEKRTTNLLIFDSRNQQSFYDLEAKKKNNSDVTLRIFQQVGPKQPKYPYCK